MIMHFHAGVSEVGIILQEAGSRPGKNERRPKEARLSYIADSKYIDCMSRRAFGLTGEHS